MENKKIVINIYNDENENLKNYVIIELENEKENILQVGQFYKKDKQHFITDLKNNFNDFELID
jgi:hypothetical protein